MNPVAEGAPTISQWVPAVVFVNPTAGSGRARASVEKVRTEFETAAIPTKFITTTSAAELELRAREEIKRGARLLVALGGDGTFQALANAAFGADVILGILPGGGGNDLAGALNLPGDPAAAARAILKGKPRAIDLVRARTAHGGERLYVGGGGVGIDAEAARHASTTFKHWPGRSRYVAAALRALCSYQPVAVRAEFPGSELARIETHALLAAVLNTPTYGAGIRLAPEARIDDGWLDVALIENMGKLRVLRLLPRLAKSGKLPAGLVRRFRARRVRLTADGACRFHGDGEILGHLPADIEVVPRAVQVLASAEEENR